MDETDSGTVPYGIYADNSAVPRVANLSRQYLGLGIMLASNEVPRIAQQFGLDSSVKEYTKPLFSIPTHHFLFFPGNINPKDFEDALMVEPNEYALIKLGERGTCLYRCGNERYLLLVQAPEYKAEIFGSAGGR